MGIRVCCVVSMLLLLCYLILMEWQIRKMNHQLDMRWREHNRQPIRLTLIHRGITKMAANINRCFMEEEKFRRKRIQEEKELKEMIANISHDLRTPLTAIRGYQQLIERDKLSTEQRLKLSIAQKHAKELEHLIEQFFEYSYLTSREQTLPMTRIHLANLVSECLAQCYPLYEASNREVNFMLDTPVYVLANEEAVLRIVHNLLRNAMLHSKGMITVRISVEQTAKLIFENQAEGLTSQEVEHLFERFYCLGVQRHQSTGLGLSIVRLLAEQMGGRAVATLEQTKLLICVEFQLAKK